MRRSPSPARTALSAPESAALRPEALAEAARALAAELPSLARRAEAGGLQLVAEHIRAAQRLAERVAAAAAKD